MSRTALCELFGISRETGYKWIRRFERSKDWREVEDRSRRPHDSPNATPASLISRAVQMRKKYPRWGPVKLRQLLYQRWPREPWPSASTIGAILKREGLVRDRRWRRRLPVRTRPFAACREPNDLWCIDFKGQFKLGDGRICYPLTVMDAVTRFLLACVAFHAPTLANVRAALEQLFRRYGLPKAFRSDNGEPFASTTSAGGLTQLSAWWARLGIRIERIDPGKPQQNGRHERMHLTLKQETCAPPKYSLGWQQRAFDRFLYLYNNVRPHQALDLATPASLYEPSPRRAPRTLPPLFYPCADVYRVDASGNIRWGNRKLFINSALAGELVGIDQLNRRYAVVVFADVPLGYLDNTQLHYGLQTLKANMLTAKAMRRSKVSAMSPV